MKKDARAKIQAFGGFLTAMVIPNMGAFIAWGLITALFIPAGWMPNETFAKLSGPMVNTLLPLLLAYAGGNLIAGPRGGIAGTVGTIGLIVGASIPMFLGAMIMGPLSAWVVKKFDQFVQPHIPTGFEMLINNFSLGIIAFFLCLLANSFIGPIVETTNNALSWMINALVSTGFLPLVALLNEPAKVLFLNNVIDQGVYYPLGMQAAAETGKSIYFMLASNPGAGLGLLLAYSVFGKGTAKATAPGAIIIHFFGGIHEMYFPFILMKPLTLIGMIGGSACGIATAEFFDAGLVAGPSPGSILAYLALTPKGNFTGVIAAVAVAATVSFLINSAIIKASKNVDDSMLQNSMDITKSMKSEGKAILNDVLSASQDVGVSDKISFVAVACDAGMGSSALGASLIRNKLKKAGVHIRVENFAIENVPTGADVVVVHENLLERAKEHNPNLKYIAIKNYMGDPAEEELINMIIKQYKS